MAAKRQSGLKQSLAGCLRTMSTFLRIAICASLFVLVTSAIGAAGGYKTVFMGELREAGATIAHCMNRSGQVVGESGGIDGDSEAAFTWTEGSSMQPLAALPGGDYGQAFGVNDMGLVVGSSNGTSAVRAVIWGRDGKIRELGALPGDNASQAFAVNNLDQVAGFSSGPTGTHAFLWSKESGMKALEGLPGADYTEAMAINDAGQVVGRSGSAAATHAVIWNPGEKALDLGMFAGDRSSRALAINKQGAVVGSSHGTHGTHAFYWTKTGGMQNIGSLPGGNFSEALAINGAGQVVGMAGDGMGYRGFLWTSEGGLKDLNDMLPADSGVLLVGAFAINDKGQIATYGGPSNAHVHHFNAPRGYLLNPFEVANSKDAAAHKTPHGEMPGMQGMESGREPDSSKGNPGTKISVQ
jgi:probable HAF family extracellular repeat protein